MNQPASEQELKARIIKSGKVVLRITNRFGNDPSMQDAVYSLEAGKDLVSAFTDLAEHDPEDAINVLNSAIAILFHGYQMHSAKAELARLREGKS